MGWRSSHGTEDIVKKFDFIPLLYRPMDVQGNAEEEGEEGSGALLWNNCSGEEEECEKSLLYYSDCVDESALPLFLLGQSLCGGTRTLPGM